MKRKWTLQRRLAIFVTLIVLVSLAVTFYMISLETTQTIQEQEEEIALNTARMVAGTSMVHDALEQELELNEELQNYTNYVIEATNTDFVVVLDREGIRRSHPNPDLVGLPFEGGDEKKTLERQEEYVSTARGTLGESLRAFSPVYNADGDFIGAVAVGITLNQIEDIIGTMLRPLYMGMILSIIVGVIGAVLLARRVKKLMYNLEPEEIATLLEERSAMLESTKEGIVAIDKNGLVRLTNAEANEVFRKMGLNKNLIGQDVEQVLPGTKLKDVLNTNTPILDRKIKMEGFELLINEVPVRIKNQTVGAIATFKDKTDVAMLAEQLTGVKLYANALRAQTHEFMNTVHVLQGLIHLKQFDQAAHYLARFTEVSGHETEQIMGNVKDTVLAGFLIGKQSYIREQGVDFNLEIQESIPKYRDPDVVYELVTIIGNLLTNAVEAVSRSDEKLVELSLKVKQGQLRIEVSDSGQGMNQEQQEKVFKKGYSTKGEDRGFGLALIEQSVTNLKGDLLMTSDVGIGTIFTIYIPFKEQGDSEE
ncbi:DcuS/MalK family sensor histidine kinase [Alkalicoccobacillus murimartini]|uniref:histidine kinase n=1 Tax=Alkalicoccobacillus murimartini TaxID=171685 RepID=A0ABT9YK35_9BACI|nr:DcuS/MalK family sensor histidine kinase [Alkalicoccobacillus murimartini]MDQ0208233.1 CitB family two-component system sensor histidine kinase MalK [Alkalicoccobacillus murimartini]